MASGKKVTGGIRSLVNAKGLQIECVRGGGVHEDWRSAVIVPLYKGKGEI